MGGLKIMGTNELQVRPGLQIQPDAPLWTVKPCNTTGCVVVIRIQASMADTVWNCRWCQANADYNTDSSQVRPTLVDGPHISKDEFGENLFELIKTISELHMLRKQLNVAVHRNKPTTDLTARYKEAQRYLANQLPTLTDDEMARVLARYPDVVGL